MPGLAQLVQRELARRQEGDNRRCSKVRQRQQILVAPAVADAVMRALRKAYPRRMIMRKIFVESSMRMGERPMTEVYEDEVDRAVSRAAERIAKLREKQ